MSRSVSSRENPWFKRFRKALERHDEEIVIEGRKPIRDSIARGVEVIAVAADDESLLDDLPRSVTPLLVAPPLLAALSVATTPQGIVALCRRPAATFADIASPTLIVVLDAVQDPGNVGTLIRLAAAFSADAVLLTPGCADPYSAKSLRSAVGTTWVVPVVQTTVGDVLAYVAARDLTLLAADSNARALLGDEPLPPRVALVMGSEGQGVSAELSRVAQSFRIDTNHEVESLNVAAAAAIALYEIRRRR